MTANSRAIRNRQHNVRIAAEARARMLNIKNAQAKLQQEFDALAEYERLHGPQGGTS